MFKFTPKEDPFFEIFIEMAKIGHDAARKLHELVKIPRSIEAKIREIEELEHKGDVQVHSLLALLNQSFITPLDREDLFQLGKEIDDITDAIESTAHLFQMMNIRKVREEAIKMVDCIIDSTAELVLLMQELKKLKKSKDLQKKVIELNRLENEGDRIYRSAVQKLFAREKNAIEVIRWKEFFGYLENVIDACEDTANLVAGVVMKNG
jgi:predicted phosphate transport protein (TIGR00153 family)